MCSLSTPIATSEYECTACGHITCTKSKISYFAELQHSVLEIHHSDTIAKILGRLMSSISNRNCTEFKGATQKNTCVEVDPKMLVLHLTYADVKINLERPCTSKVLFIMEAITIHLGLLILKDMYYCMTE
jgi:hypothetical protein